MGIHITGVVSTTCLMHAHQDMCAGQGDKFHAKAVDERFHFQGDDMSRQRTGDVFEIEVWNGFGSEGGDAVMELIDRRAGVFGSVHVAVAEEDHEGSGKGIDPEPVSYTHLDVYKRQGHRRREWTSFPHPHARARARCDANAARA